MRLHYLKWVGEAMENPETNGIGVLAYNLLAIVHGVGPYAVIACIHPWNLQKFIPAIDAQVAAEATSSA